MPPVNVPRLDSPHPSDTGVRPGHLPGGGSDVPRSAPPAALSAMPSAFGLLKALRRRWLSALLLGVALAGAAAAGMWYAPFLSTNGAFAIVRIARARPALLFAGEENHHDFEVYQKTQAALVKNPQVLEAALRRPTVAELPVVADKADPLAWLERDLSVDYLLGPEQMRIVLKSDRPKECVEIVNAIAETYLEAARNREQSERAAKMESLTALQTKQQEVVNSRRRTLRELLGPVEADAASVGKVRAVEQKYLDAERELAQLKEKFANDELRLKALQSGIGVPAGSVPDVVLDEMVNEKVRTDPDAMQASAQLQVLDAEIAQIRRVAVGRPQALVKAERDKEAQEGILESRRRAIRRLIQEQGVAGSRATAQTEMSRLQVEVTIARQVIPPKEALVKKLREEAQSDKKATPDLQWLQDDVTKEEKLLKQFGERLQSMKVESQAPARATLFQTASVLPRDDKRQVQMAGMAGAGTFGLVLLAFAWLEFRSRRVGSLDEVAQGLGIPLLGTVPKLPARVRGKIADAGANRDQYWLGVLNESVDVTRTMLLRAAQAEDMQVILVTSATEGEGKTSLASQLAASLARAGRRTLLLDCDLRKPAAHRLFDAPLEPGFCELLRAEVNLSDIIRPTRLSRLWMIAAGVWDNQATQALAQEHLQAIIDELRSQYDFVIVDSSPVLPVVDTLLIAQHVDAAIFSVLRDESRLPKVYAAYQRMTGLGIRMLGAVVTGTSGDAYGSPYSEALKTAAK